MREKISKIQEMPRTELSCIKRKMREIAETKYSLERQAQNFISIFTGSLDE